MTAPRRSRYEPLLGTSVEVLVEADHGQAQAADNSVVAEVQRLSGVFSVYDSDSELSRWCRGEIDIVSSDLAAVLELAQHWFTESGGAFHPVCRALRRRWEQAVADQMLPDPGALREQAQNLATLPFRVVRDGGTASVERTGDCTGVDLNAVAKGYIVDRALERAAAVPGVRSVVVNAGGDLRHGGEGEITVRIEDPDRPFDNAEPLTRVVLSGAALATSGSAHRGFQVGGRWLGHVLDPRTGWPVDHARSVSVIAADTATADVLATVLMVLPVPDGLRFADAHDGVAALVVAADGKAQVSSSWPHDPCLTLPRSM